MKEKEQIVNRVAGSSLVTFDLEEFYTPGERVLLDISDQLHQGLILREKEFREFIRTHNWTQYTNKFVAIHCTAEAIIPLWAYMLVAVALQPHAAQIALGTLDQLEHGLFEKSLAKVDWTRFQNAKVVVKGCSKVKVPVSVYVYVTSHLMPHVSSLMFGEPCSTVPLFKIKQ